MVSPCTGSLQLQELLPVLNEVIKSLFVTCFCPACSVKIVLEGGDVGL